MRNKRMNVFWLSVLIVALGAIRSSAATINALSCGSVDLQNALNQASSGDFVQVPAGSCAWSSGITVPDSKKLTLQGAGSGSTIIAMSATSVAFNLGNSGSRLTGFSFIGAQVWAYTNNFRIDHSTFSFSAWSDAILAGSRDTVPTAPATGLIDHNYFSRCRILTAGTNCIFADSCGAAQGALWAMPVVPGDGNAIYIEDNVYFSDVFGNALDQNYGGRYVFRFNTISDNGAGVNSGLYIESHSVQGGNRAAQLWEIYGNTLNNTGGFIYEPFRLRGGTGVAFNNRILGNWSNYEIALDNVRSRTDEGPFGMGYCDGTSSWDQNLPGQTGWHCRDQIGVGYDAAPWNPSTTPVWNQVVMPVYAWNNKKSDGVTELPFNQIGDNIGNPIQPDRDYYNFTQSFNGAGGLGIGPIASRPMSCTPGVGYWANDEGNWNAKLAPNSSGRLYKCTSPNVWTLYYTPYPYPHPLQGGALTTVLVPAKPAGLALR